MSNDFRIVVAIDLKAGTNRLLAKAQRYGLALNAVVDIIHVAPPDPDFVGYMKSGGPTEKTQDNLIRDSQAKALRDEHQQTQNLAAALRAKGVRVERALTVQGPTLCTPIWGNFPGCCARAASGQAAAALPRRVIKSRRFTCIRYPTCQVRQAGYRIGKG
jgi:Universal stress protein family